MSESPGEPLDSPGEPLDSPGEPVSALEYIYVIGRAVDFEGDPHAGETVVAKPLTKHVIVDPEIVTGGPSRSPAGVIVKADGSFALKLVFAAGLSYRLSGAGMPKVLLHCDSHEPGPVSWASLPLA